MSKYIELARKLRALAEKGVGGERVNAEQQLRSLMEKHGFTMEDIEAEEVKFHEFVAPKHIRKLFLQIVGSVIGADFQYAAGWDDNLPDHVAIEMTQAQAVEVESKFQFFVRAWEEDVNVLFHAFVKKNDLYSLNATVDQPGSLTLEEYHMHLKAELMAKSLDKRAFRTQING